MYRSENIADVTKSYTIDTRRKTQNYQIALIQSDIGVNRCVTNLKHIINGYEDIPKYPIDGF